MNIKEEKRFWSNFGYEGNEVVYCPTCVKGMTRMTTTIDKYIDRCLIDDYAKDYSLDISCLPSTEQQSFLSFLYQYDAVMQDLVQDRMQELINQRLITKETQGNYDRGLIPRIDQQNGEVIWIKREESL